MIRIILGSEAEKLKKKFQKLFKEKYLYIVVQCNLKITNYLDITLNLNDSSYHPYRRPSEETKYINVSSGHLPSVISKSPQSIVKRLSVLLSPKIFFRSQPLTMKNTLKTVGMKLSYNINNQNKKIKTKRKQTVTLIGSNHRTASP